MRIEWDTAKEERNQRKHGFGSSLAHAVLNDPLTVRVCDRFEHGEHRWHAIAPVSGHAGSELVVVVHSYPDPDDDGWIRVIGVRKATRAEGRRYEEGDFG